MSIVIDTILYGDYGAIAFALAATVTVFLLIALRSLRARRETFLFDDPSRIMSMLALAFIASTLVGLLSAARVFFNVNPTGPSDFDRLFRVALIALRVFIIGDLAWVLRETRRQS